MSYVFANCDTAVGFKGGIMRLHKGDAWHATDPFVKARPELFSDLPTVVHGEPRGGERPVETATARPGEKRTTRRG